MLNIEEKGEPKARQCPTGLPYTTTVTRVVSDLYQGPAKNVFSDHGKHSYIT